MGQLVHALAWRRDELAGVAVANGKRSRLVQDNNVNITRRLNCPARLGDHIDLRHSVDTGYADRRQEAANGRGHQANQQCDQAADVHNYFVVPGQRHHRGHHDEQRDRQRHEHDGQSNLVGCLLALRALDQLDHAVEESGAGVRRNPGQRRPGHYLRSAEDRRTVAAALPEDQL